MQVREKLGSQFSFSTVWIPGIELRLPSLAGILAPLLAKALTGVLVAGLFPSLGPHDYSCILQSHAQTIAKGHEETRWGDTPNRLKFVLRKVKMMPQYVSYKHLI